MLLRLQKRAVYGPVRSRRLGRSLGVNVLPASTKVCTFNCLYCHYGWTKVCPRRIGETGGWAAVSDILNEVERSLRDISPKPAYVTFSGNGEPTLHPRFPELVDGVTALRDRFAPSAKTAILSNSTVVGASPSGPDAAAAGKKRLPGCSVAGDISSVIRALGRLDVRIMKLDCGSDAVLRRYNRPCGAIGIADIVAGLAGLDSICIQTLLAGGDLGNTGDAEIAAWIEAVVAIRPLQVQLYTLDRGYASRRIEPVPHGRLYEIRKLLTAEGIRVDVYYSSVNRAAEMVSCRVAGDRCGRDRRPGGPAPPPGGAGRYV